jgi:NACalpha-BTF3-like transcription factor
MSIDGISYMIETRCSTEEALHYVKTKHDKDDLWLGETRNKTIPRRIRVNSIDTIEEVHSDTIDYLKEVAQYRRRKILKARSPSSQFNEISDVITVADRVDELYNIVQEQGNEISHLKSEMSELRIRVQISEQNIKLVGEAANVKTAQLKEEILKLKDFYTIEQIAAMLEISDRRVKYLLYGK